MRSEVTELTPEEQDYARSRLAQLAEQFTADGTLRSPQWEQAFRRTWRHPYVPCYYLDHGAGPLISAAEEQHRSQWLDAVYRDQTLVTKMVPVPGRKAGWYTSSSTMPSLMLTMLQALDLTDGPLRPDHRHLRGAGHPADLAGAGGARGDHHGRCARPAGRHRGPAESGR
ncbi:MAG: hypothetical protein JO272_13935 [Pseudonocardiales bacterium]|nr:hypothetical protein [Pseudonocardiales bacterium]